ncbi:MAG: RNA polymerase sigma factor [Muribaculaceae bacterium]|nr:RNA polymerase sigma factor [Muribaculaceae bacterium]
MRTETFKAKIISLQSNLLSFAYTLTSNRDDAYDLLQDTTLKALDSEDKYEETDNFKGWIFTIMRNLFINHYRKAMRSIVVTDQSDDLYQLNFSQESGLETPEGSVNVHDIRDTLNSIDPTLRDPFALYVSGYHYNEIAERLALPLGTVKSRIHQARKLLQTRLSDLHYD